MATHKVIRAATAAVERAVRDRFPGVTTAASSTSAPVSGADAHVYVYVPSERDDLEILDEVHEIVSRESEKWGVWILPLVKPLPEAESMPAKY